MTATGNWHHVLTVETEWHPGKQSWIAFRYEVTHPKGLPITECLNYDRTPSGDCACWDHHHAVWDVICGSDYDNVVRGNLADLLTGLDHETQITSILIDFVQDDVGEWTAVEVGQWQEAAWWPEGVV